MKVIVIILLIIGILLLLVLLYLLIAPFRLYINTRTEEGVFQLGPLVKASLYWVPEQLTAHAALSVPFYHHKWDLMEAAVKASLEENGVRKTIMDSVRTSKKNSPKKSPRFRLQKPPFTFIKKILKSFTIYRFACHIDTGDYCLNAQLFPLFYLWSANGTDAGINFNGENYFILDIRNSGINVIYYLLTSK